MRTTPCVSAQDPDQRKARVSEGVSASVRSALFIKRDAVALAALDFSGGGLPV